MEQAFVIAYVVPSAEALDTADALKAGDHVVEVGDDFSGRLGFEFFAVPKSAPNLPGEVWRFIVEGKYGLVCTMFPGDQIPLRSGVPGDSFTLVRTSSPLQHQAIPEEVAYLRFQQLMHANQVKSALDKAGISTDEHARIVEATVRGGRGIQGPTPQGIWEIVCSVPMRICPVLEVKFEDDRYKAELVDVTSIDRRLETVRVRFKVLDQTTGNWIKKPVRILSAALHAEL